MNGYISDRTNTVSSQKLSLLIPMLCDFSLGCWATTYSHPRYGWWQTKEVLPSSLTRWALEFFGVIYSIVKMLCTGAWWFKSRSVQEKDMRLMTHGSYIPRSLCRTGRQLRLNTASFQQRFTAFWLGEGLCKPCNSLSFLSLVNFVSFLSLVSFLLTEGNVSTYRK